MRRLVLVWAVALLLGACDGAVQDESSSTQQEATTGTQPISFDSVVIANEGLISDHETFVGSDGLPVIVYGQATEMSDGAIHIAFCEDLSCLEVRTVEVVNSDRRLEFVDAAIGADWLVRIVAATPPGVVDEGASLQQVVLTCENAACTSITEATIPDEVFGPHDIQVGPNGNPIVATLMMSEQPPAFALWMCEDPICENGHAVQMAEPTTKPGVEGFGFDPDALGITPEGSPLYYYTVFGSEESYVASCTDPTCGKVVEEAVEAPPLGGASARSYTRSDTDGWFELRLLTCADESCSDVSDLSLGTEVEIDIYENLGFLPENGSPIVVTRLLRWETMLTPLTIWVCAGGDCSTVSTLDLVEEVNSISAVMLPDQTLGITYQTGIPDPDLAQGEDLTGTGLSNLNYIRIDPTLIKP